MRQHVETERKEERPRQSGKTSEWGKEGEGEKIGREEEATPTRQTKTHTHTHTQGGGYTETDTKRNLKERNERVKIIKKRKKGNVIQGG